MNCLQLCALALAVSLAYSVSPRLFHLGMFANVPDPNLEASGNVSRQTGRQGQRVQAGHRHVGGDLFLPTGAPSARVSLSTRPWARPLYVETDTRVRPRICPSTLNPSISSGRGTTWVCVLGPPSLRGTSITVAEVGIWAFFKGVQGVQRGKESLGFCSNCYPRQVCSVVPGPEPRPWHPWSRGL